MNGVLYISENYPPEASWGVEHTRYSDLKFPFFSHEPPVIVAHAQQSHFAILFKLVMELAHLKMETRLILFGNNLSADQLMELGNIYKIFYAQPSDQVHDLESIIQRGLASSRQLKQNKVLVQLFREQNSELKNISEELEDKIKKRQSHLIEANDRLRQTNHKANYLGRCLFAIHNAQSIDDLEKSVSEILAGPYLISWFRIHLTSGEANNLELKKDLLNTYTFTLTDGTRKYGSIIYGRDSSRAFKRDEKDFLDQISESISLCIDRLLQVERNKELQLLWEATFNAVSDPLVLIDQHYNVKIANQKFREMRPDSSHEANRAHFGALPKETSAILQANATNYRVRDEKDPSIIYEVSRQGMMIDYQRCFFFVYHNISKQLHFERQLLESAKLAELGTISSSIAHELNNPLGGMLNFTQLIKMDLKGNEDFYADIVEIEAGIQKCKLIVQNLLGFSRIDDMSELRPLEIHDVIHRAILVVELRTRALGIKIDFNSEKNNKVFVEGRFNQMAHAICNVLQNSYESIIDKRKTTNDYAGTIQILISVNSTDVKVDILDDGKGIAADDAQHVFDPLFTTKDPDKHAGLGLTLARQILADHHSHISLSSQKDDRTSFSIVFPRLRDLA